MLANYEVEMLTEDWGEGCGAFGGCDCSSIRDNQEK